MGIINFGVWVVVVLYMLYVIGYTYQFIEYYEKDLARWANRTALFKSMDFKDFMPRKGFKCDYYLG